MKKRILIVDDSIQNRRIMEIYLGLKGYKTDYAENGLLALNVFKKSKFDAVLLDLHMPVMDGRETARNMKKISPYCPILMVSGDSPESEDSKDEDYDAYLKKPLDYDKANKILDSFFQS